MTKTSPPLSAYPIRQPGYLDTLARSSSSDLRSETLCLSVAHSVHGLNLLHRIVGFLLVFFGEKHYGQSTLYVAARD